MTQPWAMEAGCLAALGIVLVDPVTKPEQYVATHEEHGADDYKAFGCPGLLFRRFVPTSASRKTHATSLLLIGGCVMPRYEYVCLDCQKVMTVSLSLKDHGSAAIACSSCHSKRMEQLIGGVMAKTSRKS
jgi:putative FmdB family regulatory protein